jgi:hypothetical protein
MSLKKKATRIVILWLSVFLSYVTYAQKDDFLSMGTGDSIQVDIPQFSYMQLIIPAALMTYGTIEAMVAPKYRMLNYAIGHEVIVHKPKKFEVDDISQYVPVASIYALNLAGIKGKSNFKDRTIVLGLSALFIAISVNSLKYTVREERPDRTASNSFPSGHTAVAFMGAEFLLQEYKDVSAWYGIAGYTIAAGTGAFRVYNNKHWVGDIAFGAGLGMLCTKLAYWIYPSVNSGFSINNKKGKNVAFYPYYNGQQGGFSLSIQL